VAAVATPNGWRVARTAPEPLLRTWQRRLLLWLAMSALLMLPLAWFFARRLTRPIRAFAAAADRMGADPNAPPVPEDGPAELQVTAHALNRMQGRIADYVSERTAMIGAIAHDLRTPLARIAFRIEAAPDHVREKVQSDIEQMRAMIAATIGFVKGSAEATGREKLDLTQLLQRLIAAEKETGRPVTLRAQGEMWVSGDAIALARLVQNLVDNAISYGARADVELSRESGCAVISVSDEGPGLPEALLERVFEPFQRADPSRNRATGGIGLGLTIARSIARDHGGTLSLRNRSEGGMAAECRIPLLTREIGRGTG
jgi:two-component system OmpR family sensor kinase